MLMGVKARTEGKVNIQTLQWKDFAWFIGIVLSGLFIWPLIFIGCGFTQRILVPTIFSILWLLSLFICNPTPTYSLSLALVFCIITFSIVKVKRLRK